MHEADEGGYCVAVPAIPGCATQGETLEELLADGRVAVEGCVSIDIESAQRTRLCRRWGMFTSKRVLVLVLGTLVSAGPALAARKADQLYSGIMVGWKQVEKPSRLAGALRGAMLGAALTPPPPSGPSGAGDGITRAAQGATAAQQAQEHMRYPTRWFTTYFFRSGYYIVSASMRSSKKPAVRTGDTVRFRIKKQTLFLIDDAGKTFKPKIVGMHRTSTPYAPAARTGKAFSPTAS